MFSQVLSGGRQDFGPVFEESDAFVARGAEETAYRSGLVVVVYGQGFVDRRLSTDGTAATLLDEESLVFVRRDPILLLELLGALLFLIVFVGVIGILFPELLAPLPSTGLTFVSKTVGSAFVLSESGEGLLSRASGAPFTTHADPT
nr:hypothetical protein [Nitrolancea hollandica]